jgi:hypothetical protein
VRGRGPASGTISEGSKLKVPGCKHEKLTVWVEMHMTVAHSSGIANRRKRLAELWTAKLAGSMAPQKYGCVQVRELWGQSEERHYRPGHHWVFEFGDAGDGTCIEKSFKIAGRSFEIYKGVQFHDGEHAIKVKRWLHRTSDASALTFEAWQPTEGELDPEAPPAEMIVNSSELRGVCTVGTDHRAELRKILPPAFERSDARRYNTRRASAANVVQQAETEDGVTYYLREDIDNEWRMRCE